MPELPEVESTCRGLSAYVEGKRLSACTVRAPKLRFDVPHDLAQRTNNAVVQSVSRRAKYIVMRFDNDTTLVGHLGMSGRFGFHAGKYEPIKHDHLLWQVEGGGYLVYHDPRRFGFVKLADGDAWQNFPEFQAMGPEPLSNALSGPVLKARLKGKTSPIKTALLDQRVVAGLGNIYVCEALFEAGIRPTAKAGSVSSPKCEILVQKIKDILTRAIAAGGSSLKDHRLPSGELGVFQDNFYVYGRENEACLQCGGKIKRLVQAGRSTFYCRQCQK